MSPRQDRTNAVTSGVIALTCGMQALVGIAAARADEAPMLAPFAVPAPMQQAPAAAPPPVREGGSGQADVPRKKPSQIAQEATTPNAVVSTESALTEKPPTPRSSQANSKGFVADSRFDLEWRNYTDYFHANGGTHRHAWVEGLQAKVESGFTQGPIGFGLDAALFGALKLDGGNGARNMVYLGRDGEGANRTVWAYPGMYAVKARISDSSLKYGLQDVSNPFLDPHDNRALPPTFLGVSLLSREIEGLGVQAGSFTKVDARGQTNLTGLKTTYGGVAFRRVSYAGATWDYSRNGSASLYADQADDVWRQYYASLQHGIGAVDSVKLTGFANVYSTHDTGAALQGPINNTAFSASLTAQHGPHALLVGYQKIFGDQFFDYIDETAGVYLVNSMDVDYNAPHEQSLQVRYTFDGKYAGMPGLLAMVWAQQGWGADTSANAARYGSNGPSYGSLYLRNGQPVHGRHHEFGFIPTYVVQSGPLKNTKVTLIAEWHVGSAYSLDSTSQVYRLLLTLPMRVF
ncbi:OprD family outer membrane porin [Trinickia soli]|nr:OprD family outer membrane porin [Trinickia soli]CAB3707708.1 Porin D [Trinickia soli]